MVFTPTNNELLAAADRLRPEWVLSLEGIVKERPEGMQNPDIPTGTIEIEAVNFEVISHLQETGSLFDKAQGRLSEKAKNDIKM